MRAATTTTAKTTIQGLAANVSIQLVPAATPKMSSWTKSVMSSCATWIQYSCGSLMKIQMKAVAPMSSLSLMRRGSQNRRTDS